MVLINLDKKKLPTKMNKINLKIITTTKKISRVIITFIICVKYLNLIGFQNAHNNTSHIRHKIWPTKLHNEKMY